MTSERVPEGAPATPDGADAAGGWLARDPAGVVAAVALAVALAGLGWIRHRNFHSGFDLAVFDQGSWQLSQGRTQVSLIDRNVFADHASPVIAVFGVLYRLAATPLWWIVAQAAAVGALVLPMRAIARHAGQPPALAVVLTAASAPLLSAAMFDVHPSTLGVPFLGLVLLAALRDRPGAAVAGAVAAALCRADLGLAVAATAIVAGRRSRPWLAGVGLGSVALGAVVPAALGNADTWTGHYDHLGTGPLDALTQPWRVAGALLSPEALGVAGLWLLSVGFLVLLRPRFAVAAAVAGLPILLSQWEGTQLPWYHYGATVAPILLAGAVLGWGSGALTGRLDTRRVGVVVAACLVLSLALASPLSPGADASVRVWSVVRQGVPGAGTALRSVGDDEVVSATLRLAPHLSQRERVYAYPMPFAEAPTLLPPGLHPRFSGDERDAIDVVLARRGESIDLDRFTVVEETGTVVVLRPR